MKTVTLLTAHPDAGSFNSSLADAWARGAETAGATVLRFDVTRLSFEPVLRGGYSQPMPDEPDLARVRAAFERSTHVTWSFPTWWAGLPAALKALVDRLMLPGWAFRYEGGPLPVGLLAGRSSRYITTMDSPWWWYRLAHHDALAGSFGRGTLAFTGFAPVERTLVFRTRHLDASARARWVERVERQGRADVTRRPA